MCLKGFVCVLLLLSAEAFGQTLPQHWKRIGEAELSILWFDVYNAELLSADGRYAGTKNPLILKLNYRRNISQQDLLEETQKQMTKFAVTDQTDQWLTMLSQIWPDIRKGDQLAFWIDQKSTGHFFITSVGSGHYQIPHLAMPLFRSGFLTKVAIPIWQKNSGGVLSNDVSSKGGSYGFNSFYIGVCR